MSRWRKLVVLLTFTGICGLLVKQYIATASLQAATTLQSLQARQAQLLGTSRGARDSIDVKRLQAEVKELKEQLSLAVGTPTTVREHSHEMSYAGHASIEAAVDAGVDVRLVSEGTLLRQDTSIPVHEASEVTFTYESCVAKISEGKGRPALPLRKKVHWLHIPKSGTTLGVSIYSMVCQKAPSPRISPVTGELCDYCGNGPDRNRDRWDQALWNLIDFGSLPYCNWNVTTSTPKANFRNHVPLYLDNRPSTEGWMVVSTFRDPRQRLVSGWNHDKHAMGIGGDRKTAFDKEVQTFEQYTSHRHIQGCATKMLIGAYCAASRSLTVAAFDEAMRRLESMAFVGMTTNQNATACLFSRMFGLEPQPFMFGAQARPGRIHNRMPLPGGGERVPSNHWQTLKPSIDPLDWQIWMSATRIFFSRLQEYGLWTENYRELERGMQCKSSCA